MKSFAAICAVLFLSGTAFGQQSRTIVRRQDFDVEQAMHKTIAVDKNPSPHNKKPQEPHSNKSVQITARVIWISLAKLQELNLDCPQLNMEPTKDKNAIAPSAAKPNRKYSAVGDRPSSATPDGYKLARALSHLSQDDLAWITAEPRLWVLDGCTGSIRYGTPVIVPQRQKDGSTKLTKHQGNEMTVTPVVSDDKINLKLRILYRQPNANFIVTDLEGVPIGGFCECNTSLDLRNGEPFAICGPLDSKAISTEVGVPYVSRLPVVGVLFQHTSDSCYEVASFIIVTATVSPIEAKNNNATRPTNRRPVSG